MSRDKGKNECFVLLFMVVVVFCCIYFFEPLQFISSLGSSQSRKASGWWLWSVETVTRWPCLEWVRCAAFSKESSAILEEVISASVSAIFHLDPPNESPENNFLMQSTQHDHMHSLAITHWRLSDSQNSYFTTNQTLLLFKNIKGLLG